MAAERPTNRFKIPTGAVFTDLDGAAMKEPGPDGKVREVTLALVLGAALTGDVKVESVTLNALDRLILARKFRDSKEPEIKLETLVAVKKLVAEAFRHAPLIAGQALELLGDEPSKDL